MKPGLSFKIARSCDRGATSHQYRVYSRPNVDIGKTSPTKLTNFSDHSHFVFSFFRIVRRIIVTLNYNIIQYQIKLSTVVGFYSLNRFVASDRSIFLEKNYS